MKLRRPPPPATALTRAEGPTAVTAPPAPVAKGERARELMSSTAPLKSGARAIGDVTVVGAGPAGLAQVALMLRKAHETGIRKITLVEMRESYSRPVGVFLRQMVLDALAWLMPDALDEIRKRSGHDREAGSALMFEKHDGHELNAQQPPQPERFGEQVASTKTIAEVADEMFASAPVSLATLKDVEEAMLAALEPLARAHGVELDFKRGFEAEVVNEESAKGARAGVVLHEVNASLERTGKSERLPAQGLVVVTEGAAGRLRGQLRPSGTQMTAPRERSLGVALQGEPQQAPPVATKREFTGVYKDGDGNEHAVRAVRGVHPTNGVHWTVVGVPAPVTFSADDEQAFARDVESWVREWGQLSGPTDMPIIFGPQLARVDGHLTKEAVLGDNLVLVGDVVGTSHFAAAGGAATALTTHVAAMSRYLDDVAAGTPASVARAKLDEGLRAATLTWALYGLPYFHGDPWELRERFIPKALLDELLPPELRERYWPANGGAPSEGPWRAWFARSSSSSSAAASAGAAQPTDIQRAQLFGKAAQHAPGTARNVSGQQTWDRILDRGAPPPSAAAQD